MTLETLVGTIRAKVNTAFPVKSIYKQTTVDPKSSDTTAVQNTATLGGQAEHASLPSLGSLTDSGYLGALPVKVKNSLGGVSNKTGIPAKWLAIGLGVFVVLAVLHFARRG